MKKEQGYTGLAYFKIIAALLVIAIHTSPLADINGQADFILTRIAARTAVPFFFMVTGFFVLPKCMEEQKGLEVFSRCMKKTALLYGAAILLYIPLNVYTGYFTEANPGIRIIRDILVDGTFYHLWYLPAVMLGMGICFLLLQKGKEKTAYMAAALLYVIGVFGDSYYGLAAGNSLFSAVYDGIFSVSSYTRNGLFFAPVFLLLGYSIAKSQKEFQNAEFTGLFFSAGILLTEGLLCRILDIQRHDSMYFSLPLVMYFLFRVLCRYRGERKKQMDELAMLVYIIHPFVIVLVRGAAKVTGLTAWLVDWSLLHYLAVALGSFCLGSVIIRGRNWIFGYLKKEEEFKKGRAWMEVNLENLEYNIGQVKKMLKEDCDIMAVVKANAYGHGAVLVAKRLNELGIRAFAVAAVKEGEALRRHGIKGEILILGYTNPREFPLLTRWKLAQTVVDEAYAKQLHAYKKPVDVHIKLDTGMHRLGGDCRDIDGLMQMFSYANLHVKGTYSHLSMADCEGEEQEKFTRRQIEQFYETVGLLQEAGCQTGKLHLLSSYGLWNYPEAEGDYVRIGLAMYGVLSRSGLKPKSLPDMKPVMAVRARVALVRDMEEGEAVGYGGCYKTRSTGKIAVISIGYGDGLPGNLWERGGRVIIRGQYSTITGKICMDQCMADVTGIRGVRSGDLVTIIGNYNEMNISAEEMAERSGIITNELLSGMGERLERVYI